MNIMKLFLSDLYVILFYDYSVSLKLLILFKWEMNKVNNRCDNDRQRPAMRYLYTKNN